MTTDPRLRMTCLRSTTNSTTRGRTDSRTAAITAGTLMAYWLITVLAGLGPVVTSHMVRLAPPAFALDDEAFPLPAAEPHAARATVIAAAAASVSHLRPLA